MGWLQKHFYDLYLCFLLGGNRKWLYYYSLKWGREEISNKVFIERRVGMDGQVKHAQETAVCVLSTASVIINVAMLLHVTEVVYVI